MTYQLRTWLTGTLIAEGLSELEARDLWRDMCEALAPLGKAAPVIIREDDGATMEVGPQGLREAAP